MCHSNLICPDTQSMHRKTSVLRKKNTKNIVKGKQMKEGEKKKKKTNLQGSKVEL